MTPPALFAIHLRDGILQPGWVGLAWIIGGFVLAGSTVILAGRNVPPDDVPKIGLLTAAFFVASQIHFPVGVGSAHLILNGLLGVVLRHRAPLAIAVGLTFQALLFGHGGLTMLGVNAVVIATPALVAGALFPALLRLLSGRTFVLGVLLGSGAALASVGLNAVVLAFSGREEYYVLAGVIVATNLPFVAAEGVATGAIVAYLARVKPEWLSPDMRPTNPQPIGKEVGREGSAD